ncbi:unnamed protein product [Closterium sp. Naga37s-1]|nr:unnamed protein product [Closterium sp. Naga37s-1]
MVNYPMKPPRIEDGTLCMLGARTHSSCTLHLPPTAPIAHSSLDSRIPYQQQQQQNGGVSQQPEHRDQSVLGSGGSTWPVVRSGFSADKGGRQRMEDAHVAVDDLSQAIGDVAVAHPRAFYGIFDGHGGDAAAQFARQKLLGHVVRDAAFPLHVGSALRNAFLRTDRELETARTAEGHAMDSGTTALAVLLLGRSLYVANAGDCRAVLCRRGQAVELSRDHRAVCQHERARVERAGGDSDSDVIEGPLIADPEVHEAHLSNPEDEFLVLACDGLWDAFNNEGGGSKEVVAFARRRLRLHNDPQQCSKDLVEEAIRRHACDNVTVLTVCFSLDPPPLLQHHELLHSQLPRSFSEYSLRCLN